MFRTLAWWGAGLVVAFVLVGGFSPPSEAASSVAERKIEEALDSPTQLEFIETPLVDVIDYLKDYHQIEIQIDQRAMDEVGVDSGAPVTENIKGVSLRSALNLMLRDLELTYFIGNEVLVITTIEEAECQLSAKVYPVDDLVRRSDAPIRRSDAASGGTLADYDTLIEIITSTVKPTTWDDVGGPGSIAAAPLGKKEMLVISQTYHVHREIADLLSDLRIAGDREPVLPRPYVRSSASPPPPDPPGPAGDLDPFGAPPEDPPGLPPAEPPSDMDPGDMPRPATDPFGAPLEEPSAPPAKSNDADPFSE